ncbi:Nif11-like leader peptide family natural product precursor [Metallumcola ferriviriculae]|uniref:Nif11-like leader peptide family natural product n=1 Tax=Metallumcola ferriviriculae TaxID=3039180 RepID=A0AAU0UPD7_9FIRM|nr:Nif11-like leader peptide family natural product precursor [Desulfitibacteraceae bacterium MK1]
MSVESAKKFLEKVKNDEDFKNKLSGLKNEQERLDFSKAEGFDFSVAELTEANGGELSDNDLDEVAGGISACGKICKWGAEINVES